MSKKLLDKVLLLYDFDDPVRLGLITKMAVDFGYKNVVIAGEDNFMEYENEKIFSNYIKNIRNTSIEYTSRPLFDIAEEYQEDGYFLVGYVDNMIDSMNTKMKPEVKICSILGVFDKGWYLYNDMCKIYDYKLKFPDIASSSPDEVSRAAYMFGIL